MPVTRHTMPQIVTKKNAGTKMEAPLNYDVDSHASKSLKGKPASTNPGSPSQRRHRTRRS